MTNRNYLVADGGDKYVVRVGDDIPVHGILRSNELAAARAAHGAGLAPEIVYQEPGFLVMRFIDGRTLTREDLTGTAMIERVATLVRRCHQEIALHLRGPALAFWPFHILRGYAAELSGTQSRWTGDGARLVAAIEQIEARLGPVKIVFGHNDLLAANFIDDGDRLWLIDWEYAGFNAHLFDLAGLIEVNKVPGDAAAHFLDCYDRGAPKNYGTTDLAAMACIVMAREAMWSMVAEKISPVEMDFAAYTTAALAQFDALYERYRETAP